MSCGHNCEVTYIDYVKCIFNDLKTVLVIYDSTNVFLMRLNLLTQPFDTKTDINYVRIYSDLSNYIVWKFTQN